MGRGRIFLVGGFSFLLLLLPVAVSVRLTKIYLALLSRCCRPRFIGVFYLGFSLGPMVGAYFIRNPLPIFSAISPSSPSHSSNLLETFASRAIPGRSGVPNVTSVFWVAILCSFVNLVFAMGFLPESMDKVKRRAAMKAREAEEAEEALRAQQEEVDEDVVQEVDGGSGAAKSVSKSRSKGRSVDALMRRTGAGGRATLKKLFGPLAVFAPRKVYRTSDESGRVGGARTDWSLTLLAGSLAFYLLSSVSPFFFLSVLRRGEVR